MIQYLLLYTRRIYYVEALVWLGALKKFLKVFSTSGGALGGRVQTNNKSDNKI